jgi:fibronectin type 3 domain-containing protein
MKIALFLSLLLFLNGCKKTEVSPLKSFSTDDSLKVVKKIRTLAESEAIAFEWVPVDDDIAGYNIYREELDQNGTFFKRIVEIGDSVSSHYVDINLNPNTTYTYLLTTYTSDGRESKGSEKVIAKTRDAIPGLHFIVPIGGLPNKAKLIWRPHPSLIVSGYIVERSDIHNSEWKKVGELNHRLDAEFIDKGLNTNQIYRYRIYAKTFSGGVSKPSKVVEAVTKALPKPVENIITSNGLPKEIEIKWNSSEERDVRKYRVYRSSTNNGSFEFVGETDKNIFYDKVENDGVQKFYKVTAVDKDNLESIQNEIPQMGSTLFKPKPPKLISVDVSTESVSIKWEATDPRSLRYIVYRKSGSSWNRKSDEFQSDKTSFVDKNILAGATYLYGVVAIDKYGIVSEISEEREVTISQK